MEAGKDFFFFERLDHNFTNHVNKCLVADLSLYSLTIIVINV